MCLCGASFFSKLILSMFWQALGRLVGAFQYLVDDMWLILDLALAALFGMRLYISFFYGMEAKLTIQGFENTRLMDNLSAVSSAMLLAGSCRFWRSFRFVVMTRRFFIKAAPSLVAVSIFIMVLDLVTFRIRPSSFPHMNDPCMHYGCCA